MRVAVVTTGGDAPGLNAAVVGVVRTAELLGWDVVGLSYGFDMILTEHTDLITLSSRTVARRLYDGGTMLGAANDKDPTREAGGVQRIADALAAEGIDALIVVGGDGSQKVASALHDCGVRVVGVPKTIDRDLLGSEATLGFDTAVEFVAEAVGRLRDTADAHHRVHVVEVMGRHAGWLALYGGLAGGADAIMLPELAPEADVVAKGLRRVLELQGFAVVVVAEGLSGTDCQEGTTAERVAQDLGVRLDAKVRALTLAHLLRGGRPIASDRLHGLRLGSAAVDALAAGVTGVLVGWDGARVVHVPLGEVAGSYRSVTHDDPTLLAARRIGVVLGD